MCVCIDKIHSAGSDVSGDEEDKDDHAELTHDDDEQDVDDINHTQSPKEEVHVHSPIKRRRGAPVEPHMKCIDKYNLPETKVSHKENQKSELI